MGLLYPRPIYAAFTYRLAMSSIAAAVTLIFLKNEFYDQRKLLSFTYNIW